MALGAQPRAVQNLLVRQGMVLVGFGVAAGVVGAVVMTHVMPSILSSEVSATDLPTFLGATLVVVVIGLVATYIPARRITRIDPMVALRND